MSSGRDLPAARPAPLCELHFLYQPVVPLHVHGRGWAEALVRWSLPDGTVRGPPDVLPHWLTPARIDSFTRFTLDMAASALTAAPNARLSVNLSPAQAVSPETLRSLDGLPPTVCERLGIEITEQRFADVQALAASLGELRSRCAAILLDDVTPGDLAMRSLRSLEKVVGGVKIDRSVIWLLSDGEAATQAERFVREACERFEVVVAEGVEDPNASEALAELGVSHAQGFACGRPRRDLEGAVLDRRVAFGAAWPGPALAPASTSESRATFRSVRPPEP